MKLIKIFILIIITSVNYSFGYSWEVYDKLIATVNETPIIESEVIQKLERLKGKKNILPKTLSNDKSRLLDKFIDEAIVEQTAKKESIIVSPQKIDNQINKIMERMDYKSIELFKKEIERTEKISFEEYKEEIKKSIMNEQIMQIVISMTPPSLKEAEEWYKGNKGKMGYEVNIQHIMITLKNESYTENKRVNKIADDLIVKIRNGHSFETIAKEYSEDAATKNSGGKMGWIALSNLAKKDMILAENIYKEFIVSKKKIAVLKSNTGYHIVKYNGTRPTSFENAREDIFNLLYQKKMMEQFKKWVLQKKSESDIKIYMHDYVKEKANG